MFSKFYILLSFIFFFEEEEPQLPNSKVQGPNHQGTKARCTKRRLKPGGNPPKAVSISTHVSTRQVDKERHKNMGAAEGGLLPL
jgi:hypothetical protein